MPWLERLDARIHRWPRSARWAYLGLKWYVILLGGFIVIRLLLDRTGIWPLF